ncbi:helix-turn-helix domain-containing protein [Mycetocola miduiensis]|uniref:Helix-turn-helix domain-containing protein n=1 Tax=Mycetocola miduiensis TaxID=995034 RepID=A0A1I5AXF3_9MICO|nr:helix-turn-helix transcriptional regulator [Mycetocola miduiensis]SFN67061.1 Helix-turn-helix domain-containing protein [Mycetocola miduiensis]
MDTESYTQAIAAILRGRKAELNMSNDDLVAKSGIPERTFSRLLSGERPMRMGQFFELVDALGLEPGEVMGLAKKKAAEISSTGAANNSR